MTAKTTRNKIEQGVCVPADLPIYAFPFLFSAYRFGLFVVRNVFNVKKWDELVASGYVEYVSGYQKNNILVSLTDKGASFVEKYALAILETYSPYYTFPIVKAGDKVDITSSSLAFSKSGSVTLVEVFTGINTIHSIDRNSIQISPDEMPSRVSRVTLKPSKDYIKFATKVPRTRKEFNRRFGKIVIRTILDKTEGLFNGILVADQLDKLFNKRYAKNRIVNS